MKPLALITGAAGGIGSATVRAFLSGGWLAVGVDQSDPDDFPEAAIYWQVDLSESDAIDSLIQRLRRDHQRLDALINNAAIQVVKPVLDISAEEWDAVQQVNLGTILKLCQAAYPLLEETGGAIVNTSSIHALATSPDLAAYAASKAGLLSITRSMALEFGPAGVRVNAVLPGAVDTPMLHAGLDRAEGIHTSIDERLADLAERIALGRVGRPSEIAQAILFLADAQRSSYITGQSLVVDGGVLARLSSE